MARLLVSISIMNRPVVCYEFYKTHKAKKKKRKNWKNIIDLILGDVPIFDIYKSHTSIEMYPFR